MNLKKIIIPSKFLVLFVLFFTIIMESLIIILKLPTIIRFLNDLILIMLIFVIKDRWIKIFSENNIKMLLYVIFICATVFLFTSILNAVSPILVLWAFRNTFRGIVYFVIVITYLNIDDLDKIFEVFLPIQFVNLLLAFYQSVILHHQADFVGGIFGYGNGAAVNTFNALLISFYLNRYLLERKGFKKLIFVLLSSLIIAVFAEEKMTYILIFVIFLITMLLTKFSYRKILIVLCGIICIVIGLNFLKIYDPASYEILTNIDSLKEYSSTTYDEGYRIPRVGAFEFITKKFLINTKLKLFGYGFGNCESGSIAIFNSQFYQKYGNYNYRWFTHQWTFLETGYVGVISYLSIFGVMLYEYFKKIHKVNTRGKKYVNTGICMIIMTVITFTYNATLKVDMSYILYFGLAVGFVAIKNKEESGKKEYEKRIYFDNSTSI